MPASLQLVFCGTPHFAVSTLEILVQAGFNVSLVVTQPDRPKGRGLEVVPSPVKQSAMRMRLPVAQPETIKKNEEFRAQLTSLKPDAIIVVGYGRIVPPWMLDLPPLGNINLHASLLPKYRGAAPIQWAIALGETLTGVTTMKIDAGLDTGDVLLQAQIPIALHDTSETLSPQLAAVGAKLTVETLRGLENGTLHPRPQDDSQATLAPILKKEDGLIDFSRSASEILNRLRGFQPWPGAYSRFRDKGLHVWQAVTFERPLAPSQLQVEGDHLLVGCAQGTTLRLLELQVEGKKRSSAADFIRGYRPESGERLG